MPAVALALLALTEPAFAAGSAGASLDGEPISLLIRLALGAFVGFILSVSASEAVKKQGYKFNGEGSVIVLLGSLSGALLGALGWWTLGGIAVGVVMSGFILAEISKARPRSREAPWGSRHIRKTAVLAALSTLGLGLLSQVSAVPAVALLGACVGAALAYGLLFSTLDLDADIPLQKRALEPYLLLLLPAMLGGAALGAFAASWPFLLAGLAGSLIGLISLFRFTWNGNWPFPKPLIPAFGALAGVFAWHLSGGLALLGGMTQAALLRVLIMEIVTYHALEDPHFPSPPRHEIQGHPSAFSFLFAIFFAAAGGLLVHSHASPSLFLGALAGLLLGFLLILPNFLGKSGHPALPAHAPYLPLLSCLAGALAGGVFF